MSYEYRLSKIDFLDNTLENAINQTEMYSIIMKHFYSPLPEGKKVKKAVVIGYDGCTSEMLLHLDKVERGAVRYLLSNGGHGVFSYAGGMPYPEPITQATSTAPGWCSMLTGCLAENNKVFENGQPKDIEPKSLLIKLVEDRIIKNSGFYVSWGGHFEEDDSTYINEKNYIRENGLKSTFICAEDDRGTRENVLRDLIQNDCSDFIFSIFEYPDHNGHGFDYKPEAKEYMQAFLDSESTGMDIIDAIHNRLSYDTEDWLILVTSDHGGINCSHGGQSLKERSTFIVSNKEIVTYTDEIKKLGFMENSVESALPQTVVSDLVKKHFEAPLPEGKTKKKAIVLGYDGCRADMLEYLDRLERGAIKHIISNGGHAVFTFAGGAPYPKPIEHETDTGPGWGAILTGLQSKESTIYYNCAVKEVEPRSTILSLAEDKLAASTAFYVSWDGHFTAEESTYRKEKEYAEKNGINAEYLRAENDEGTLSNALEDIKSADCSDYIFTIFEFPDIYGHGFGFSPYVDKYMFSFRESERVGMDLIEAIESRNTYDTEDWLILVTPDHGGIGKSHGGPSLEERITFIVSNKEL